MDQNINQNLLDQVEKISHEVSKCSLDFTKIKDKQAVIDITDFLSISFEQAVLFACLIELSLQRIVTLEALARHLKCSILKVITLLQEIEVLEKKSLVKKVKLVRRRSTYNDIGFTVPQQVIESLRTSDKSLITPPAQLKFPSLLQQVWSYVKEREDDSITTKQLLVEIEDLLANNSEHYFIKYINRNLANPANKCISLALAYYRLTGQAIVEVDSMAIAVFDDIADQMEFRRTILTGLNELVKSEIVRIERSEFFDQNVIVFSQHAVKILYREYPELVMQELSKEGVIKYKSIRGKQLYFDDTLKDQINDFISVLSKNQFHRFQTVAHKCRLNTGITAIFHGFSGTGKTELVLQIAKKTRRDLFMVDLSQTKSMWFGQSEKQVKKIFDDYRELLRTASDAPILFVNEADGLFSKRMDIGANSSSVAQTQNTIQNIMLQELEIFNGILIATTNLTGNIDKAFERRFLFKINFPKPDKVVRQQIWKSKLPELSEEMAIILGERFELTGGQIDNQVRQLLLKKVLERILMYLKH